jgi:hypothetical protein
MKYFAIILSLIFILFAFWQLNDPDPILWVPIYLLAAYVCFRAYQGKSNAELLIVCVVMYLAGGINAWLQMTAWEGVITDTLAMKSHNQELAREALGLGICAVTSILFLVVSPKQ